MNKSNVNRILSRSQIECAPWILHEHFDGIFWSSSFYSLQQNTSCTFYNTHTNVQHFVLHCVKHRTYLLDLNLIYSFITTKSLWIFNRKWRRDDVIQQWRWWTKIGIKWAQKKLAWLKRSAWLCACLQTVFFSTWHRLLNKSLYFRAPPMAHTCLRWVNYADACLYKNVHFTAQYNAFV